MEEIDGDLLHNAAGVFCVESEFYMKGVSRPLRGYFLLIPDRASLAAMLRAVRVS